MRKEDRLRSSARKELAMKLRLSIDDLNGLRVSGERKINGRVFRVFYDTDGSPSEVSGAVQKVYDELHTSEKVRALLDSPADELTGGTN